MADITYRANLSTPTIPVDPRTFGRTVIIKGSDQNYTPSLVSKTDADKDAGIPQVYYMANVLPTEQGYRSVGFTATLESCPGAPYLAFPVRSAALSATLVHTRSGHLYEQDPETSPEFRYIGHYPGALTYATVAGVTYINIAKVGCYSYDFTSGTLLPVTLDGLEATAILGIVSTGGYLLAWSADAVAWSSLTDATDLVPSLDTGAGGGSVEGARGAITYCVPNTNGVFIFTAENCISATLSNNAKYPFNFKEVVGSSGVTDLQAVTFDGNQNAAYAFTSGGFQKITQSTAAPVWADLSDSADNAIVWDETTVINTEIGEKRGVTGAKLAVAGARYICVSIQHGTVTIKGTEYPLYRDIWIFDISLQRWGRIVKEHLEVFSDKNNKMAIITSDGKVVTVDNSNAPGGSGGVTRGDGVIVLGKYQYTRQRYVTLQEVSMDNLYPTAIIDPLTGVNLGMEYPKVYTLASGNGTWQEMYRQDQSTYLARTTELNHSIMVKGNFNLNSVILTLVNSGGR